MALGPSTIDLTLPHIRVLGEISISRPGLPVDIVTGGTATVLAALVAARDATVSHREIAALYWPDVRPSHWHGLISFYRRWLQRRLPTGWTIEGTEHFQLTVESGWVDAWHLNDVDPSQCTPLEVTILSGQPYVGLTARGVIADSRDVLKQQQDLLPGTRLADETLRPPRWRCSTHRGEMLTVPDIVSTARCVLILTHADSPSSAAMRTHLRQDAEQGTHVVEASGSSAVPFGDVAVALAGIRWALVDIAGGSEQSRIARAWRLVHDYIASGQTEAARMVFVDADRLDDWTLRLVTEFVRFPVAENMRIVLVGDVTNDRPLWKNLLRQVDRAEFTAVAICNDCAPQMLVANETDISADIAQKHQHCS